MNNPETELQVFIKQMLQCQIFLGNFQERRYVNILKTYRDVVVVANSDNDFKNTLDIVKKRLYDFYLNEVWVGITDPNFVGRSNRSEYCIWTKLYDQPLGWYWFRVKSVKYRDNEVLLRLKCLRPVSTDDPKVVNALTDSQKSKDGVQDSNKNNVSNPQTPDWNALYTSVKQSANENTFWFFSTIVTLGTTVEILRFLGTLLFTIVIGILYMIRNLGEYSLKFLHELSLVINALTPISLGILDLIAKIIGGFYILIAMMWRQNPAPPRQYNRNFNGRLKM